MSDFSAALVRLMTRMASACASWLDLARRAQVTGAGAVERLELAVDGLAIAYPGHPPPGELLARVRAYLGTSVRCWTAGPR
jgi:hypothetical protein